MPKAGGFMRGLSSVHAVAANTGAAKFRQHSFT